MWWLPQQLPLLWQAGPYNPETCKQPCLSPHVQHKPKAVQPSMQIWPTPMHPAFLYCAVLQALSFWGVFFVGYISRPAGGT
jgi:hypothetical protein